jgi:predicted component of type VI protein secretion system
MDDEWIGVPGWRHIVFRRRWESGEAYAVGLTEHDDGAIADEAFAHPEGPEQTPEDAAKVLNRLIDDVLVTDAKSFPEAVPIPLSKRKHGIIVGAVLDVATLMDGRFVLALKSAMSDERLRRELPSQARVSAIEHILRIVRQTPPGTDTLPLIGIRPLPEPPRQVPLYPDATYFELERDSPHWRETWQSKAIAIFVPAEFHIRRIELWAYHG